MFYSQSEYGGRTLSFPPFFCSGSRQAHKQARTHTRAASNDTDLILFVCLFAVIPLFVLCFKGKKLGKALRASAAHLHCPLQASVTKKSM